MARVRDALPAQDLLCALLRYEPDTGKLFWRERPRQFCHDDRAWRWWNTRYAGTEAFVSTDRYGYKDGRFQGRQYLSHRVIWKMMTGEEPDQIDHENGIRDDNRWENLRSVTIKENARNQRRPISNTSGFVGVIWNRQSRKWQASIRIDGDTRYLGTFPEIDGAIAARKAAEREYGFHENHGQSKTFYPDPTRRALKEDTPDA